MKIIYSILFLIAFTTSNADTQTNPRNAEEEDARWKACVSAWSNCKSDLQKQKQKQEQEQEEQVQKCNDNYRSCSAAIHDEFYPKLTPKDRDRALHEIANEQN